MDSLSLFTLFTVSGHIVVQIARDRQLTSRNKAISPKNVCKEAILSKHEILKGDSG